MFITLLVLSFILAGKIDDKIRIKYNELFKKRNAYYVFDLKKEYEYDDLVLMLENIKRKNEKMYMKHEKEIIFRLRYGFFRHNIYRINAIKYDNFIEEEYKKKVIKLNKEYTDKFGTDDDNYRYTKQGRWETLHRINILYSNKLNKELEKVISKNAYYYLISGVTSQTIVIIGNKMYIPSITTTTGIRSIKKYMITLKRIFKLFDIEA